MTPNNYLKYLFSDKEARLAWSFIAVVIMLFSVLSIAMHFAEYESLRVDWNTVSRFVYIFGFLIVYLGFYTISYINYRKQQSFIERYDGNEITDVSVEIYQTSFTVKTIRQNYDARINVSPRIEEFKLYRGLDYFVLFGFVREFGVFRMHMKPLLITNSEEIKLRNTVKLKVRKLQHEKGNMVVELSEDYKSVIQLIVKAKNISNIE
ncbi:hypothetical protein [Saccharicrinis aurantiacus]|uniref:hypothetical protein n=1 Tax=Saccharicrinis aurantiacus TaxID=1849719 RepID=UPI002490D834|nr:hypothetical protein [Saccharicrinis aurantiacus]